MLENLAYMLQRKDGVGSYIVSENLRILFKEDQFFYL